MRAGRNIRYGVFHMALAALVLPVSSQADPASELAQLTIAVSHSPMTPYESGGCGNPLLAGCYRLFGQGPPGVRVDVEVTDAINPGAVVAASTFALPDEGRGRTSDEWTGDQPGDWTVSPNVTDLGTHGTELSVLLVTARVEITLPDGTTQVISASAEAQKSAATIGDATGPETLLETTPPGNWCGLVGPGCSTACLSPTIQHALGVGSSENERRVCGHPQNISGRVEDASRVSAGIASEVADVVILVRRQIDEEVVFEYHSFVRRGTQAFFNKTVRIEDFEPGTYELIVYAIDAWGHKGNEETAFFTVRHT